MRLNSAYQRRFPRDADGLPVYFISQVQDVTERRSYKHPLAYVADHDLLTGLPNRRTRAPLLVAGRVPGPAPAGVAAEPHRLSITGEWARRAERWEKIGCRYEASLARTQKKLLRIAIALLPSSRSAGSFSDGPIGLVPAGSDAAVKPRRQRGFRSLGLG